MPRVLVVETGHTPPEARWTLPGAVTLDYGAYARIPRVWRRIEAASRIDFYLAAVAKRRSAAFDVVWAGSEKVGVPLAMLGVRRPLIVVAHHLESSAWKAVTSHMRLARRWAAVGYIADSSRETLMRDYGFAAERLFPFMSVDLNAFTPGPDSSDGAILSLGVAHRDYRTLVDAVAGLPECRLDMAIESRYGDIYDLATANLPATVRLVGRVPESELRSRYHSARFVVIPLDDTSHAGAGASVALEAAAAGKAVIATQTAGMTSWVVPGITGILIPPGDSRAMRDAMQRLWLRPDEAHQMGAAGREHVAAKYDRVTVSANVEAIVRRVHQERLARHTS